MIRGNPSKGGDVSDECCGDLPTALRSWIDGLAFGPKREYAEAYARARLGGGAEPPVPAFSKKDWPRRTRRRVDRLLLETDVKGSQPPQEGSVNLETSGAASADLAWSSLPIDILDPSIAKFPIRKLLPSLDEIGDQAIPYASLPRRVSTAYALDLRTWAQLGSESIATLMGRRGAGEVTVRAILEAAIGEASRPAVQRADGDPTEDTNVRIEDSSLAASIELVCRWWSLVGRAPTKLGELLAGERRNVPDDVGDALRAIDHYTISAGATDVTPDDAVQSLLEQLDEREHEVLRARLWSDSRETLEAIAVRRGITRERVRQLQVRAEATLGRLTSVKAHRPVVWWAHELRELLGPYLPREVASERLRHFGVDVLTETSSVLLYLAGPYRIRSNDWYEDTRTSGSNIAVGAIDQTFQQHSQPTTDDLLESLISTGMGADIAAIYLHGVKSIREHGNVWVRWGGGAIDKAHAVLQLMGEPATAEAINDMIREGHSLGTLKNGMSEDSRFIRTGKRSWGLRVWGVEEYSGIVEEILERIDGRGGVIAVDELICELLNCFPDVSESSIRMYLGTLAFVVEGGMVRRRTDVDGWQVTAHLRDARGAFRNGDSELRLAIPVTRDVLRGSGLAIHPAVALVLGITPNGQRTFVSRDGAELTVRWRPWSTNGPDIGSVRALTSATEASRGDSLVLIFGLDDDLLDAMCISAEADSVTKSVGLLGAEPGEDLSAMLSAAMDCRASEVRSALRARGEAELAELIPASTDARLENEIADLIAELG